VPVKASVEEVSRCAYLQAAVRVNDEVVLDLLQLMGSGEVGGFKCAETLNLFSVLMHTEAVARCDVRFCEALFLTRGGHCQRVGRPSLSRARSETPNSFYALEVAPVTHSTYWADAIDVTAEWHSGTWQDVRLRDCLSQGREDSKRNREVSWSFFFE